MIKKLLSLSALAVLGLMTVTAIGCDTDSDDTLEDEVEEVENDVDQMGDDINDGLDNLGDDADNAIDDLDDDADNLVGED
jgi:hypothetical protein